MTTRDTLHSILRGKAITADFRTGFGRILVHAPPKHGKTSLVAGLLEEGFDCWLADFDGGDSLSSLVPFLGTGDYQLHARRMTGWQQLMQVNSELLQAQSASRDLDLSDQVLVVDTLTKAVGCLMDDVQAARPGRDGRMDMDHWGQIKGMTRHWVSDLMELKVHVVLLAWSKRDADTGRWIPDLPPSLSNEIAGAMGQILYLDLEGGHRRCLRSDQTPDWLAGDRSGRLDDRCGTNLGAILKAVAARVPRPTAPPLTPPVDEATDEDLDERQQGRGVN